MEIETINKTINHLSNLRNADGSLNLTKSQAETFIEFCQTMAEALKVQNTFIKVLQMSSDPVSFPLTTIQN